MDTGFILYEYIGLERGNMNQAVLNAKQEMVSEISSKIKESQSTVVVEYRGPQEVYKRHGNGKRCCSQNGEPDDILSAKLVAQHTSCYRSNGKGGQKHEEAQLRDLYRYTKLVNQEESEIACYTSRVEVLGENKHDEDEQCPIFHLF